MTRSAALSASPPFNSVSSAVCLTIEVLLRVVSAKLQIESGISSKLLSAEVRLPHLQQTELLPKWCKTRCRGIPRLPLQSQQSGKGITLTTTAKVVRSIISISLRPFESHTRFKRFTISRNVTGPAPQQYLQQLPLQTKLRHHESLLRRRS